MTAVPLREIARIMTSALSFNTENVALLNLPTSYPTLTGTVNTSTDTIAIASGTIAEGMRVMMYAPIVALATPPGGTTDGAIYYVRRDSSTDFRLAATFEDLNNFNFIDLTSAGSGWSLIVQPPGQSTVDDAVQYELPVGNGYARFSGSLGNTSVLAATVETVGYLATFALSSGVTFNAILVIINGGSPIGDTAGDLAHLEILSAPVTTSGSPYSRYIKVIGSAI